MDEDDDNALTMQEHDRLPSASLSNKFFMMLTNKGASDIHFEPYESTYRIRMRINGLLVTTQTPSHVVNRRLASRIKVLSQSEYCRTATSSRRSNKTQTRNSHGDGSPRVNAADTMGRKIVIRLLNTHHQTLCLDQLGFSPQQQRLFTHHIEKPQGMILITGPTGSGKTVTLYSALNHLNTDSKNISTVEDPIEISLSRYQSNPDQRQNWP
ncbi:ATPase, T2SS/T4P/T4SS family [Vibrio sp. PP-XX7]